MPSTYTSRNRAEKQATGEGLNVWGQNLNQRTTDLFDEALDGVESVDLGAAATFDLSDAAHTKNGESDTSRQRVLIFSNTHASGTAITIPSVEKWYFIRNSGSQAVTLAPSGGTTASVPAGADAIVFSNGTNCYAFRARLNELAAPNGAVSMNSQRLTNVADATDNGDAVNKAQVTSLTAASVQRANEWADKTDGFVTGSENSAKSWAVGGTGDGDPAAGSAKEWATSTTTVDGGLKGARGYANDASASASSASGYATTALGHANDASGYASAASASASTASGFANDAEDHLEAFQDIWVTSASEPGSPVAGMVWFDTSGNVLKVRDATNTVWQTVTGINAASESAAGVIEIATQGETDTGTDDARAVTPKKLTSRLGSYVGYRPGNIEETIKTDTFTTTSASYVDVTGLSVTITPQSTSSRILVMAIVNASATGSRTSAFKLMRGSTDLSLGDAGGARTQANAGGASANSAAVDSRVLFSVDAPATLSPVTYKVQVCNPGTAGTVAVNRSSTDTDAAGSTRVISSIVVMEII